MTRQTSSRGAARGTDSGAADLASYEQAFEAIDRDPAHVLLVADDDRLGGGTQARIERTCGTRASPVDAGRRAGGAVQAAQQVRGQGEVDAGQVVGEMVRGAGRS